MIVQQNNMKDIFFEGIIKKNPVIFLGLGISPVIIAAAYLKSAILMAIITSAALISVAVAASLIRNKKISSLMRPIIIVMVSTIVTLIAMKIMETFAPGTIENLGLILPMTALESIILIYFDKNYVLELKHAVVNSLGQSIGFSLVICIVAVIREALSYGTIYGMDLPFDFYTSVLATPFGGFIILGFTSAGINFIYNLIKKVKKNKSTEETSI